MSNLLENKIILLTGVANNKSIAYGCAQSIKKLGGNIIYTYQNERMKKELSKITTAEDFCIELDASNDESIENAFLEIKNKYGNIDGVIHSMAFAHRSELEGDFSNTSRDGFLLAHDISAFSLVAITNQAKNIMNNGGSIVTLTYIGSQKAIPNYNVMGVAKASLEASVRYLAYELGKNNIRVNAVSAGAIKTLAASGVKDFNKLFDLSIERTPSGKAVTIEEVGNVTAMLLSDLATCITGEVIYADRGFHLT